MGNSGSLWTSPAFSWVWFKSSSSAKEVALPWVMKGQHWDPCILFPSLCADVIHGNLRHLIPSKGFCGEAIHILAGLYTTALLQTRKYPLEFTYQFRCKRVFTSKVIKSHWDFLPTEQTQDSPEWQWSGRKRPPAVFSGVLSDPGGR